MLTDDGYRQIMQHARRLAQGGRGELAQHLRDAIDLRAEVEALRADAERLDCGQIIIDTRDEFGEPKQVWHTGMNLRAAIDAAIKAGLK